MKKAMQKLRRLASSLSRARGGYEVRALAAISSRVAIRDRVRLHLLLLQSHVAA
jgi:hypothetical protein